MGQASGEDRSDPGLTIGFHSYEPSDRAAAARAFEDEVLALMADHGGRVLFRGGRTADEPETEPLELHVLWFPNEASLASYLADKRRLAAIERHGEVFTDKRVVRLDDITDATGSTAR